MNTKVCTKCRAEKATTHFHRNRNTSDGVVSRCKECSNKDKDIFRKTVRGLIGSIRSEQCSSSKVRGHPLPDFTIDELYEWVTSQNNFDRLYKDWASSGYNKWLRPSTDRVDNKLPYTLDNIQLVTFEENNKRSHEDAKLGNNFRSTLKPVVQYALNGDIIAEYISIAKASEATGLTIGAICIACNKREQKSSKWLWGYLGDTRPTFKKLSKYRYVQLDSKENPIAEFTDVSALKEYLGKKDLSPLNKSIRKGTSYLGSKWVRYTDD